MLEQHWFDESENKAHETLFGLITALENQMSGLQVDNLRNMRLYSNQETIGTSISQYMMKAANVFENAPNRITLNVIKSAIDTLSSKIAKNRIRPTFLTDGGSWKAQRQAKGLNKFINGAFYLTGIDKKAPLVFRDGCIFGTGAAKVFRLGKTIHVERVFPDELIVDPNDGYYGNPECKYHRKFVPIITLKRIYPKFEAQIEAAKTVQTLGGERIKCAKIVEGWRRASEPGKKDGRHVICLDNVTLLDEKYDRVRFPFAVFRYTEPVLGWFGAGVAEEIRGIQIEINRLLMHIQNSMRLISLPRVYLESASKVNPKHFTTDVGTFVYYTGQAPIIQAAQSVHPENFQQIESLYKKAYEIIGISQLSAQSRKPGGLDSGVAMRTYQDIETERFMTTGQGYENLHLDLAELVIDEAKAIAEEFGDFEVTSFNRRDGIEKVKWKEVALARDAYVMQIFPTSALPNQPQAKLQTVMEMMQAGILDQETGTDLLDFPDLDAYTQKALSPGRLIRKRIEALIEDGTPYIPEEYDPINKIMQMAVFYYNWAQLMDTSEETLERIRQLIDDCKALLQPAPEPVVAPTPGGPAPLPPVPPGPAAAGLPPPAELQIA